jgi:hypothetical protein
MKIIIDPWKDYSCFFEDIENEWEYKCLNKIETFFENVGWNSTKRSKIINKNNVEVSTLKFVNSFFKPKSLVIEVFENNKTIKINVEFEKKISNYPCSFEIESNEYFMEKLNSTYRILYENGNQIARFERIQKSVLDKYKYVTFAENHLSKPLIIALSIFESISDDDEGMPIDFREIKQKDISKIRWKPL